MADLFDTSMPYITLLQYILCKYLQIDAKADPCSLLCVID
jgi:hypothetical protein